MDRKSYMEFSGKTIRPGPESQSEVGSILKIDGVNWLVVKYTLALDYFTLTRQYDSDSNR